MPSRRRWDVFCRVVDNHGDLGVAWRLCVDLAGRGEMLRLWVDDVAALAWMAPQGCPGVELVTWTNPAPDLEPGDVVIETFGCDPPPGFVRRMGDRAPPPAWINLEYLSAESYVERSHGLASPVTVPAGRLLNKRFFYPGFTPRTGGLLREPGLMAALQAFDRSAWLQQRGLAAAPGVRLVSLFCYENAALQRLLDLLSAAPTLLLASPGAASTQVAALLGPTLQRGALQARLLPYLTQPDYDRLLWSCDLNFVRGEDSFVRAQWAGKPFVWQIYPQHDGAHRPKLEAFLGRMLADTDPAMAQSLRALWLGWNRLGPEPGSLPTVPAWRNETTRWRSTLLAQPELATQLLREVAETR